MLSKRAHSGKASVISKWKVFFAAIRASIPLPFSCQGFCFASGTNGRPISDFPRVPNFLEFNNQPPNRPHQDGIAVKSICFTQTPQVSAIVHFAALTKMNWVATGINSMPKKATNNIHVVSFKNEITPLRRQLLRDVAQRRSIS